jgi:isoleucyl-tRNA synthetase
VLPGSDLIGRATCRRSTTTTDAGRANGHAAAAARSIAWRVVAADFVTIDSGTGVVHQAPAFGEVDYDVLLAEQSGSSTAKARR